MLHLTGAGCVVSAGLLRGGIRGGMPSSGGVTPI